MMGAFLTWQPKSGPSKSLFFDAVTDESVDLSSVSTDHPVEEGADISDHIRKERDRCSLEVFVSNSPIYDWNNRGGRVQKMPIPLAKYKAPLDATPGAVFGAVGGAIKGAIGALLGKQEEYGAQVLQFANEFDAVADTLELFTKLRDDKQLVTVVLPAKMYQNMHLEKIQMQRNAGTGDGARFHLEFKQLLMVEAKLVNAPIPTETRGQPKKPKGAQGPKNAKAEVQKKSIAKSLIDRLVKGKT